MNDGDALLAAIRANWDEDTPRLAYADWLDEHGEPGWAAFIRHQVESAGRRHARSFRHLYLGRYRCTLGDLSWARPWELDTDHASQLQVVTNDTQSVRRCVGWYRGFPAVVGCTERSWHTAHELHRMPVRVVYLMSDSACWARYHCDDDGRLELMSVVNPHLPRVPALTDLNESRKLAFPGVARFDARACTAQALRDLLAEWEA